MDGKNAFTDEDIKKVFESDERKSEAEDILNDEEKVEDLIKKVINSLENIPLVGKYFADVPTLCLILKDYISGEYTAIPVATLVTIVVALVYFISPIDIIPDVIPVIGKIDDAAVIALAVGALHNDIADYKNWKGLHGEKTPEMEDIKNMFSK